eukprot:4259600-Alexandrium_andersonii.AAC.1
MFRTWQGPTENSERRAGCVNLQLADHALHFAHMTSESRAAISRSLTVRPALRSALCLIR